MLPRLKELRFAANALRDVAAPPPDVDAWFPRLQILDLSYNNCSTLAVARLGCLPMLRELDLTGNGLDKLPSFADMEAFPALERLNLERNKLKGTRLDVDDHPLVALAGCARLREISLAHNFVEGAPSVDDAAAAHGVAETSILREVVALDLAWNQIATEADVWSLSLLPKLEHLALYVRRADMPGTGRGGAAAVDETRRRRGRDVGIPR